MSKLYQCAKGCGSIEENDGNKKPICCGAEMIEISEEELFSCPGCAGCHEKCNHSSDLE